jgi:hypothetical protein
MHARQSWFATFPTSTPKTCSCSASTGTTRADSTFSTCPWTWITAAILDTHLSTLLIPCSSCPSTKTWTTSHGRHSTLRRSARLLMGASRASAIWWTMWISSRRRARSSLWSSRCPTMRLTLRIYAPSWSRDAVNTMRGQELVQQATLFLSLAIAVAVAETSINVQPTMEPFRASSNHSTEILPTQID